MSEHKVEVAFTEAEAITTRAALRRQMKTRQRGADRANEQGDAFHATMNSKEVTRCKTAVRRINDALRAIQEKR